MALLRLPAAVRVHLYSHLNGLSGFQPSVVALSKLRLAQLDPEPHLFRKYATVVENEHWSEWTEHGDKTSSPENSQLADNWKEVLGLASSKYDTHRPSSPQEKNDWLAKLRQCEPRDVNPKSWRLSLFEALNTKRPIERVEGILERARKRSERRASSLPTTLASVDDFPLDPGPATEEIAQSHIVAASPDSIKKLVFPVNNFYQYVGLRNPTSAQSANAILQKFCRMQKLELEVVDCLVDATQVHSAYRTHLEPGQWISLLQVRIGSSIKDATAGIGSNKKEAQFFAWRRMLFKLHTAGVLSGQSQQPPTEAAEVPTVDSSILDHYPGAPEDLRNPDQVAAAMNNLFQSIGEQVQQEGMTKQFSNGWVEYNLHLEILGTVASSTGIGPYKKLAKSKAWYQMLSELHNNGVLRRLISTPLQRLSFSPKKNQHADPANAESIEDVNEDENMEDAAEVVDIDSRTLASERDAKIEVYNYAASLGLAPECTVRTKALRRSRRLKLLSKNQRNPTKQLELVEARIKLPELDIDVSKTAVDAQRAEIAAALAFKHLAEEHRANTSNMAPANSPHFALLSVARARDFFKFYRLHNKEASTRLEVEMKCTLHQAQLFLNGNPIGKPAIMSRMRDAESAAHLTAAIEVVKNEPDMLTRFAEGLRADSGSMMAELAPVSVAVQSDLVDKMAYTIMSARRAGLPDFREAMAVEATSESSSFHHRRNMRDVPGALRDFASEILFGRLRDFEADSRLQEKQEARNSLPMMQYKTEVLEMTSQNVFSIVIGATGSGKTTQVPQIILDDAIRKGSGGQCDIICTQPRRLAASSVAERVAVERNEPLGQTVGYHVRHDARLPKFGGSITYCTTGILLEQLKHNPDSILDTVSHLVIDEVHDRDLQVDLLMIILKKSVEVRREAGKSVPQIILMSATLDAQILSKYLATFNTNGDIIPCPISTVPGRTFPVSETYLEELLPNMRDIHANNLDDLIAADPASSDFLRSELTFADGKSPSSHEIDWKSTSLLSAEPASSPSGGEESLVPINLIGATIAHICRVRDEGAILVFLPGLQEILKMRNLLRRPQMLGVDFNDESKFKISLLHSSVSPEEQRAALEPCEQGCRKIILSTNIAETSVTVPDVKFVVDSGKLREKRYDQTRHITELRCTWESNSNAKQRAGRAGRVQEGNYYAVFSRRRREDMAPSGLPELLRSDLQETCLSIKAQGFQEPVSNFLLQAVQPPPPGAVDVAVRKLQALEALTEDEKITTLGRILSQLPVHPALGKMILLGIIFRCLDPILILGSMDAARPLFTMPIEFREESKRSRQSFARGDSDHLASLAAFNEIRNVQKMDGTENAFLVAQSKYIHYGAFKAIAATAQQIADILGEAGLIPARRRMEAAALDGSGEYGGQELNINSGNEALIKCLLLAGTHPNLGVKHPGKSLSFRTPTAERVKIVPSSVSNFKQASADNGVMYTYTTLASTADGKALFMRGNSRVTPLMVILFGGRLSMHGTRTLVMDEWLPFKLMASDGKFATHLTLELRKALDRMLSAAFKSLSELREGGSLADVPMRDQFVRNIVEMLSEDSKKSTPGPEDETQAPRFDGEYRLSFPREGA